MTRSLQTLVGVALVLLMVVGPVLLARHQEADTRNFRVVREGVLYRSGQMSLAGLKRVVHDYGIRTVVTLRDSYDPHRPPPDLAEEEYCAEQEITHVRLPPDEWENRHDRSEPAPVEKNVRHFLEVMRDAKNYPVLVHCFAGIHRTGAYTAIYRMEFERWTHAEALGEMRACGYTTLDDEWDILGFLAHYRPARVEEPDTVGARN
jgi:tyrosine-protein phosphatase SIW14